LHVFTKHGWLTHDESSQFAKATDDLISKKEHSWKSAPLHKILLCYHYIGSLYEIDSEAILFFYS